MSIPKEKSSDIKQKSQKQLDLERRLRQKVIDDDKKKN